MCVYIQVSQLNFDEFEETSTDDGDHPVRRHYEVRSFIHCNTGLINPLLLNG